MAGLLLILGNNTVLMIELEISFFCCFFAAMPKRVENARIACLDFTLQKAKMHLGVSVVVEDPEKLEAIRKR